MIQLPAETPGCKCRKCRDMCHLPCWPTPAEAVALMEAGYGDRLCLDWRAMKGDSHCDDGDPGSRTVWLIRPANKGSEGRRSPQNPVTWTGCTFWDFPPGKGLCSLHDSGLKPYEGRHAHHGMTKQDGIDVNGPCPSENKPRDIIEKLGA